MIKPSAAVATALSLVYVIAAGRAAETPASPPAVTPLPALSTPAAWQTPTNAKSFGISAIGDCLALEMHFAKNQAERLLLAMPQAIEAGQELTFLVAPEDYGRQPLWINVLARDAQGREFLFYTKSNASLNIFSENKGLYLGGAFRPGLEPIAESRFTVPGLKSLQNGTYEAVEDANTKPVGPLTLLGLQIKRKEEGDEAREFHLYLSRFALSGLTSQNTKFHYQFEDEERFGELDEVPSVSVGNLGKWDGRTFDVTWDIRDRYEGQPFLTGNKKFDLDPADAAMPYALQRHQRIEFPIRQEGTYWVHLRLGWNGNGGAANTFIERDYRLFVIKGEPAVARTPLPATASIGTSAIRIAPGRTAMVWTAAEPFTVPVAFKTADAAADASYRVRVLSTSGGSALSEITGSIDKAQGDTQTVSADLTKLPVGAYQVEAAVLVGGSPVDQMTTLVGRQPEPPSETTAAIPDSGPSATDIINGDKPLFHLSPMIDNLAIDAQHSRAGYMQQFMDAAGSISKQIEYQVSWRAAEPLPGVYNFTDVDKVLDSAKERGFQVLLWSVLHDSPEWLPSMYTQNEHGETFGQNLYLFHGARLNLVQAPALRDGALRFIRNLVIHCRSHPAVQGYFVLLEQTGDAPYSGWYEGYDPTTQTNFRAAVQKQFKSVADVNRAWGTSFGDFDAVTAPRHDAPASSDRYWLDWMRFQSGALHEFLVNCAKTARGEDPKRLILVYADGLIPDRLNEFRALNCMTANGGCDDPQRGTPDYIRVAVDGIPQRAEEVSVGQWSARSATQLDASLFSMLTGGGGNANCKMYVDVRQSMNNGAIDLDLMRKPPFSLDRYEKLMPVWTELRKTVPMPRDICYFEDFSSYLVQKKTTYYGWIADPWAVMSLFDSHLLFGVVPGSQMSSAKLLLLINGNLEVLQKKTIDDLAKYVQGGGVLMMRADAGRRCVEEPTNDWALLKKFGFHPPEGARVEDQYMTATPTPKGILATKRQFVLREAWNAGQAQPGQVDAVFDNDPSHPAVSSVKIGRGRVIVVWASTVVPRSVGGQPEGAMLRDVAALAKAALPVDSDVPRFWLNLVKDKSADNYYGLVYCNIYSSPLDRPAQAGTVRYQLPDGRYQINELISQTEIGPRTAAELRDKGLQVSLPGNAVAIYRMRRLP